MNIDSASFLSPLPAQLATDGTTTPSMGPELQAGFTEAFAAQLTLLSAGNNQGELLKSIQTNIDSSNPNKLQSLVDLLGEGGDMQKLAAFFGKELPVSYKVNEDIDQEAALSALTGTVKTANLNEIQNLAEDQQNFTETPTPDNRIIQTEHQQDVDKIMAGIEDQNILSVNEPAVIETTHFVADTKNSIPKDTGDDSKPEQNNELVTALLASVIAPVITSPEPSNKTGKSVGLAEAKQQSLMPLIKNSFQNNDSIADNAETANNSLPKPVGETFSEQSKSAFNLSVFEKTEMTDKSGQIGQEPGLSMEKNQLRGMAEIGQLNRQPAEIRSEVPALTRTITHPDWNKDLGERILWMNNRSIPAAEIKLNPQHLGPISVRVDINQDQASISFAAQHSSVREALEASIPKLRDMLNAQQLNLIDVNVAQHFSSNQGRSQSQNFAQPMTNSGQDIANASIETMAEVDSSLAVMTKGLLSIYA